MKVAATTNADNPTKPHESNAGTVVGKRFAVVARAVLTQANSPVARPQLTKVTFMVKKLR